MILLFISVVMGLFHQKVAAADLHFSEPIANIGKVFTGKPLTHRFQFVNKGTAPVEIVSTRGSCGCVIARLDQRIYKQGEEGSLVVDVNTLSQAPGSRTWSVLVQYRYQSEIEEMPLYLQAQVHTEVMVEPSAMVVFADRVAAHDIVLTDFRPKPLAITDISTSSVHVKARVAQESWDRQGHSQRKISLAVAEGYAEGRHDELLNIYTDDPEYPHLKVPVTIVKRSPQRLGATPGQVELAAPPGQPFASRIVLIRDSENQPVRIDQAVPDDPALVCKWAQGPNAVATLKIQVDRNQMRSDSLKTVVRVHITEPIQEELIIPVSCTVR